MSKAEITAHSSWTSQMMNIHFGVSICIICIFARNGEGILSIIVPRIQLTHTWRWWRILIRDDSLYATAPKVEKTDEFGLVFRPRSIRLDERSLAWNREWRIAVSGVSSSGIGRRWPMGDRLISCRVTRAILDITQIYRRIKPRREPEVLFHDGTFAARPIRGSDEGYPNDDDRKWISPSWFTTDKLN